MKPKYDSAVWAPPDDRKHEASPSHNNESPFMQHFKDRAVLVGRDGANLNLARVHPISLSRSSPASRQQHPSSYLAGVGGEAGARTRAGVRHRIRAPDEMRAAVRCVSGAQEESHHNTNAPCVDSALGSPRHSEGNSSSSTMDAGGAVAAVRSIKANMAQIQHRPASTPSPSSSSSSSSSFTTSADTKPRQRSPRSVEMSSDEGEYEEAESNRVLHIRRRGESGSAAATTRNRCRDKGGVIHVFMDEEEDEDVSSADENRGRVVSLQVNSTSRTITECKGRPAHADALRRPPSPSRANTRTVLPPLTKSRPVRAQSGSPASRTLLKPTTPLSSASYHTASAPAAGGGGASILGERARRCQGAMTGADDALRVPRKEVRKLLPPPPSSSSSSLLALHCSTSAASRASPSATATAGRRVMAAPSRPTNRTAEEEEEEEENDVLYSPESQQPPHPALPPRSKRTPAIAAAAAAAAASSHSRSSSTPASAGSRESRMLFTPYTVEDYKTIMAKLQKQHVGGLGFADTDEQRRAREKKLREREYGLQAARAAKARIARQHDKKLRQQQQQQQQQQEQQQEQVQQDAVSTGDALLSNRDEESRDHCDANAAEHESDAAPVRRPSDEAEERDNNNNLPHGGEPRGARGWAGDGAADRHAHRHAADAEPRRERERRSSDAALPREESSAAGGVIRQPPPAHVVAARERRQRALAYARRVSVPEKVQPHVPVTETEEVHARRARKPQPEEDCGRSGQGGQRAAVGRQALLLADLERMHMEKKKAVEAIRRHLRA